MLSSIAESFIKRFCGRYLKNFSAENVSISVTGRIILKDIELKCDELTQFQLPYQPVRAFVGKLQVDLPLVPGNNFDITVSNGFILFVKNEQLSNYDDQLNDTSVSSCLIVFISVA